MISENLADHAVGFLGKRRVHAEVVRELDWRYRQDPSASCLSGGIVIPATHPKTCYSNGNTDSQLHPFERTGSTSNSLNRNSRHLLH